MYNLVPKHKLRWSLQVDMPSAILDPLADPKSRSTLGLYNLHHRSIRAQDLGDLLLGSFWGSGERAHNLLRSRGSSRKCPWSEPHT